MITRNNYEEFFLLYVDNELSPADRQAVERFVEAHPDLKEEWELLLQCRIDPDDTPAFPAKELLQQHEDFSLVNPDNYESWFLSYVDGELDEASRQAVIEFVRLHPEKNIELQRLQLAVNIPDPSIVFPGKESLYRKDEKRRIAWLPFARIAAAALVLGFVGLQVFHPFRSGRSIAGKPSPQAPVIMKDSTAAAMASTNHSTQAPLPTPSGEKTTPGQPIVKKYLAAVTPRAADSLHLYKRRQTGNEEKEAAVPAPAKADPTVPVVAKADPPVPDKATASIKVQPADNNPVGEADPADKLAVIDPKAIDRTRNIPATKVAAGSFATQALLDHAVAYTSDESMEERASPKKNKLRGIFRKVTRALEKPSSRAEDEDRKVLIGSFQVSLN
ncbi:hypothetical protein Q4E93_26790 [Flavitalea sp. BT771]|uniref:hypothetical protein n=1 Tax=Flavitalea sp. BT771 TaxID=3063329 RepID=UPI0026E2458D|nr:hypothetical protein [Flavitalea sp. BT771]MDO6434246.1 hypothetical protein [Flavitalea sp. BT771]MDV6223146.1 hypothetical protein [Flavitalea sp. BT771]